MIQQGEISEARKVLQSETYSSILEKSIKIQAYLDALTFIQYLGKEDLVSSISFAEKNFKRYRDCPVQLKMSTLSQEGQEVQMELMQVTALVCYKDKHKSPFAFLLTERQRAMIASDINNEILRLGGKSGGKVGPFSSLEKLMKHLGLAQHLIY
mmetsp:Transcript_29595/g.28799  ORF Transcript_29595/g.28799 Transcript_29595/m.28799 type:complete len:154 (-) Transcript_29595:85-546(-)